ncbi:MAG: type II toxin-antitoxin system PemK/MazF family toxin [Armatimonadetes bacterium]|nr:type II toxin-antitoxin system PemK/MazF family toxin [Armatimonadota bacterium]
MTSPKLSRGDVWMVDFGPVRGHEQAGTRPGLIVSSDPFNHGPPGLVIPMPITTRERGITSTQPRSGDPLVRLSVGATGRMRPPAIV